jgi:hypothetical protein
MKTHKKTVYKEAVRNAMAVCSSEETAMEMVQKQIDAGLVGDPKNRKTCAWKFEGTDMTINPSTGPHPKKSSKVGARNVRTHDLDISSKLLEVAYREVFEAVKGLQQEKTFAKIDAAVFVDEYKPLVVARAKNTILRFLEDYEK